MIEENTTLNESDEITRVWMTGGEAAGMVKTFGRITVRNNTISGCAIRTANPGDYQDDWVRIRPNDLDGLGRFENLVRCTGDFPGTEIRLGGIRNVRPDAASVAQVHGHVVDAEPAGIWSGTIASGGLTVLATGGGGADLPLSGDLGLLLVEVRTRLSRPLDADIGLEITEDGEVRHALSLSAEHGTAATFFTDARGRELSRKQLFRRARIGVRVRDAAGGAAQRTLEVELLGVRLNALA